jgi:hypothetical protein
MINFTQVEQAVQRLKKQLEAGQIDLATFEARLMELIDVADDGYYWMFGHKTETWYRHDGHRWVVDNPGELISNSNSKNKYQRQAKGVNDSPPDWSSVEWGWFLAGLVLLGVIAYVIYLSTSLLAG